nr:hypothetical protein Iba_chr07aCG5350 [Ipomoea batatas]
MDSKKGKEKVTKDRFSRRWTKRTARRTKDEKGNSPLNPVVIPSDSEEKVAIPPTIQEEDVPPPQVKEEDWDPYYYLPYWKEMMATYKRADLYPEEIWHWNIQVMTQMFNPL